MLLKKSVPTFSNSFVSLTLLSTIIFILDFLVFYFDLNIDVLLLFLPILVAVVNYNDLDKGKTKLFDFVGFLVLMIAIFCDYITPIKMNIMFSMGMCILTSLFYIAYIKTQRDISNIVIRSYFHILFVVLICITLLKFLHATEIIPFLSNSSVLVFSFFSILIFYVVLTLLHIFMFNTSMSESDKEVFISDKELFAKQYNGIIHIENSLDNNIPDKIVELDTSLASESALEILNYFDTVDSYLDCDFSLQHLADALGVNRVKLSEVINRDLNTNFYALVAQYRIQSAKKLLCDKQNLLIEGVMQEVGFSSKITFNKYFKSFVGMTPSEFRKKNIVSEIVIS